MQNKKTFIIGALILTTFAGGLLLRPQNSNSETKVIPWPKAVPTECKQVIDNGIFALTTGWSQHMQALVDQEQPVSSSVDEVFDSVRTYRCWLESFCRSVQISAITNVGVSGALTEDSLGIEPGCPNPPSGTDTPAIVEVFTSPMELPEIWNEFLKTVQQGNASFVIPNKPAFAVIPQCRAAEGEVVISAKTLYDICFQEIEKKFGINDEKNPSEVSQILTTIEGVLNSTASEKKTRALENKLIEINKKVDAMFGRVVILTQYIHGFYDRIPCTLPQCTKGQQ